MEAINALGRRKTAVARIYLKKGSGKILINQRDLKSYFLSPMLQYVVKQPLNKLGLIDQYDIIINLHGGGYKGQSEAIRLGISRALVKLNLTNKQILKKDGFLTRDSRVVERKKPGRPKARKKFQFSKR